MVRPAGGGEGGRQGARQRDQAPPPPLDPEVVKAAESLSRKEMGRSVWRSRKAWRIRLDRGARSNPTQQLERFSIESLRPTDPVRRFGAHHPHPDPPPLRGWERAFRPSP